MYTIKTPAQYFEGERCGLSFFNGTATTDDLELAECICHEFGYELVKPVEEKKAATPKKTAAK